MFLDRVYFKIVLVWIKIFTIYLKIIGIKVPERKDELVVFTGFNYSFSQM